MTTTMTDTSGLMRLMMMNTFGEAIILETMRYAVAYYKGLQNGNYRRTGPVHRSCYFFIQGSSLDRVIHDYHLSLNPISLRDSFNYCLRHSC